MASILLRWFWIEGEDFLAASTLAGNFSKTAMTRPFAKPWIRPIVGKGPPRIRM
jgi:hypothetical protein